MPAARIGDTHVCPLVNPGPVPHVGGPVVSGFPTVLIGGMPASRIGDGCICVGPADSIVAGSTSVMIGGAPASRLSDACAHGGVVVSGCITVLIGMNGGAPSALAAAIQMAADKGMPLVEECKPEGG